MISGVSTPEPAPGEKWTGGEVQAGLELLNFLRPMPGFEQVASVDVSEFGAHKRLSILTVTGGMIVWGAAPTKSGFAPGQAPPELKRERLAAVFRQFGQLDAGRPMLDVRSEDGVYTLDTTGVMAGYVGWRHAFTPKLRSNLIYARSDYDNDAAITGPLVTKSVQSLRANMFYTPMPKVDVGAELMYGVREIEDGRKGDIRRVQFTTKYSF